MPFSPPAWCSTTSFIDGLSLEIIKGGVRIECIDLQAKTNPSVPYLLTGRQKDAVDIHTEHPSCSRIHAALVRGNDSLPSPQSPCELHLIDLGSTHGTFVNKSLLPKQTYQALNIGDVIRFGASTRLYVLSGPDDLIPAEYDSANLQTLRAKSERRDAEAINTIDMETVASFATWGMGEDSVEDDDDELGDEGSGGDEDLPDYLKTDAEREKAARKKRASHALQESDVSSKDAKVFETLQRRRAKVENLYTEIERIMAKEGNQGGLSAGQQNQVDRNRQRIEELEGQIDSIENTIRAKNLQRTTGKLAENDQHSCITGKKRRHGDDETDKSFYDRTKSDILKNKEEVRARRFGTPSVGFQAAAAAAEQSIKTKNASAMTYEQLVREEQDLLREIKMLEGYVQDLDRNRKSLMSQLTSDEETGVDLIDRVIWEAEQARLRSDTLKVQQQIDTVKARLTRAKILKEVAKPALPELIEKKILSPNLEETIKPLPHHVLKEVDNTVVIPSSVNDDSDLSKPKSDTSSIETEYENELLPPKRTRPSTINNAEILKSAVMPESGSAAKVHGSDIHNREALKFIGPLRPEEPVERSKKYKGVVEPAGDTVETISTWVPPPNQSGDGRTALNAKLGY